MRLIGNVSQKMNRPLQFTILICGGLVYSFFTFQALMWAVWGAPTHPIQYIALFSALGLLLSAFVCLASPDIGRWIAIVCTLGIGVYYVPATKSLVPSASLIISPVAYLLIAGYFVLLSFCLFYPRRVVIAIPVLILTLITALGFSAHTFYSRMSDGEYRRPAMAYFKWTPSEEKIHIKDTRDQNWLTEEMLESLSAKGVGGSLDWQGSQNSNDDRPKMIIISSGPIPENKDLHYPKGDSIIYIFDGSTWSSIPADPEVYPSFATLERDGMIRRRTSSGGIQGTSAFRWKSQ
jgi:hypothetical protein